LLKIIAEVLYLVCLYRTFIRISNYETPCVSYDTICTALARHGVSCTIRQSIRATLEGRLVTATLAGVSRSIEVARGCPQGGVLSPLLWCLVVDELITELNGGGIYAQGYADICLPSCGKIPKHSIRAHAMGPSLCGNVV
jgi:hypothetical protein